MGFNSGFKGLNCIITARRRPQCAPSDACILLDHLKSEIVVASSDLSRVKPSAWQGSWLWNPIDHVP